MNILIFPIANAPRICDECPEADCTYGYVPPCFSFCGDYEQPCQSIYTEYNCSSPNALTT